MLSKQTGQSLVEVVVVIAVGIIVVSALVFATIASIRNAQFAKNQAVATKLAQEGIEFVKSIRNLNADGTVIFTDTSTDTKNFSDLWGIPLHQRCNTNTPAQTRVPCYFKLETSTAMGGVKITGANNNPNLFEKLSEGMFERQVQINDTSIDDSYKREKNVTVVVRWSDFSGMHESKLTTILRKL